MKPIEAASRLAKHAGVGRFVVLALLALLLGISARTAAINGQMQPWGAKQIVAGIVSDSLCGSSHFKNGHGDADCTRLCVKQGADYALVSGSALLILKGHQADLDTFAGRTVLVVGIVRGDRMTVESVAPLYTPAAPVYTMYPRK